jgi:hypothetical protein
MIYGDDCGEKWRSSTAIDGVLIEAHCDELAE